MRITLRTSVLLLTGIWICDATVLCCHLTAAEQNDAASEVSAQSAPEANSEANSDVGRPVRIVSFSFRPRALDQIITLVDREGAKGADLITLPELCRGQDDDSREPTNGPTIAALKKLASKHGTYILCPLDVVAEGDRKNRAVLIDRQGNLAGYYDKVFPYWSEYDHSQPVAPGSAAPVFQTDFGKLGVAICFDVNFPEVWQQLASADAELVIWPSAYSAGRHLQAYSLLHHYYIVTSTWTGDCQVYDITGERIRDDRSDDVNVTRVTLDLDRGIYHQNFNIDKRDKLLKEQSGKVAQERYLDREQWFVLKATEPGVSARSLAREYGLEELRDYIDRSRAAINNMRGRDFPYQAAND